METLLNIDNKTPHPATDKAPNRMNDTDINNLIKKKEAETDIKKALFHHDAGTKVRPIITYKLDEK
jgi:hypothetical protein